MIQDYPHRPGPTVHSVSRELLALTASALLYPLGWIRARHTKSYRAEQRTIVLIHGYLGNRTCFAPLKAYMRLVGYKNILSYEYKSGSSIEASAIGLKKFLKENVRGGRIDLICHRLGGLIALTYLCDLGGARRVDRCIKLGTPMRGTYNAYWVPGFIGRDLRPDSQFLRRIGAVYSKLDRVKFTSIVGELDNIVIPRVFAEGKIDNIIMPNIGHVSMLFSPKVFRVVTERLAESPRVA